MKNSAKLILKFKDQDNFEDMFAIQYPIDLRENLYEIAKKYFGVNYQKFSKNIRKLKMKLRNEGNLDQETQDIIANIINLYRFRDMDKEIEDYLVEEIK